MTINYRDHYYKRGFWLSWSRGKPLRFAYVGKKLTVNYHYFFNV